MKRISTRSQHIKDRRGKRMRCGFVGGSINITVSSDVALALGFKRG